MPITLSLSCYVPMAKLPESQQDEPARKSGQSSHDWQRSFVAAYVMLGSAPAGAGLGYLVDHWLGTSPFWTGAIACAFLLVSLVNLLMVLRK
jgi:F0F1-type ATP synthase assembly protein I